MTIKLSDHPNSFIESCANQIRTIRSCQTGISFLAHFVDFIIALKAHSLTSKWIQELEKEIQKRNEVFSLQAMDALEEEWIFLWKKHPQFECKKALIQIKWYFTRGIECSSQMPFEHTLYSFIEFKIKFNCNSCSQKLQDFIDTHIHLRMSGNETLYKEYIQTSIEMDPVYFWDRLRLLEKIYSFSPQVSSTSQAFITGTWTDEKSQYWQNATVRSTDLILRLAQEALWKSFNGDGFSNELNPSSFLSIVYHFTRKDCENYLDRLLVNIRDILPENNDDMATSLYREAKTRPQQKADELVKHASGFWEKNPEGKYEDAYAYYVGHCRISPPYSRSEWEKKVRDKLLDPRPPKKKTRGNSK